MDSADFAREIGVWDPGAMRLLPALARPERGIFWNFDTMRHVGPPSGPNLTKSWLARKGIEHDCPAIAAVCLTQPHICAVVMQIVDGCVHVVDEISLGSEASAISLGQAMRERWGGCVVVPDAAGRHSKGGRSAVGDLTSMGYRVRGPVRNPADVDLFSRVCAALESADGRVTLRVDPSCRRLIAVMQKWCRSERGVPEVLAGHEQHLGLALGYGVHWISRGGGPISRGGGPSHAPARA